MDKQTQYPGNSVQSPMSHRELTARLFCGEILRFSQTPSVRSLITFARALCERGDSKVHPTEIHTALSGQQLVDYVTSLRQDFLHHPRAAALWADVFKTIGFTKCQLTTDRLLLRIQPHCDPHDTPEADIAIAPLGYHRDTWGSNIYAQINWWAPLYPVSAERTMAIYPGLFRKYLSNSSSEFDLPSVILKNRRGNRKTLTVDSIAPQLRDTVDEALARPVVIEPGDMLAFSGAHLHRSIPNHSGLTRVSLETRTVVVNDVVAGRGAPNVDGESSWSAPGWFRRECDNKTLADILGCEPVHPYQRP